MNSIYRFPAAVACIGAMMVCLAAASSSAGEAGVLPLKVSGEDFDAAQIDALSRAVEAKFARYPDVVMMPVPDDDPLDVMLDAGCEDLNKECLVLIGRQRGADSVLYTTVAAVQGQFRVAFRYVEVDTGKLISVDRGASPGDDPAAFLAFSLEEILGTEPGAVPPPPPPPPPVVMTTGGGTPAPVAATTEPVPAPPTEPTPAPTAATTEPTPAPVVPVTASAVPAPEPAPAPVAPIAPPTAPAPEPAPVVAVSEPAPAVHTSVVTPVATPEPSVVAAGQGVQEDMIPVESPPQVKKEPFYKTWWFWTIIGVAVVGAGTAAGVLATQDGPAGGQVGFSPDPGYAPLDVTLYR